MDKRDGRGVIGWLVVAWLLLVFAGLACALEINRGQDGYESPIEAVYSIRDSTGLSLPLTLDFWASQEADMVNLDLWLHGLHTNGDSTWAKTCQDTLRIGRVYR
jgi:hypothetical protein